MIELGIFIAIVLFCVFANQDRIIYLLFALLPFHTFLKSLITFLWGGGNIIAFWKEFAIISLLIKVFWDAHYRFNRGILWLISGFMVWVVVFFFLNRDPSEAIASLRDHFSPILLMLALASYPIKMDVIKKSVLIFSVAIFANCILGFLQNFFYTVEIATLMGSVDFIDSSGYVQYKTDSARILGIERMAGVLGGPNLFGMFYSFVVVFLLGVVIFFKKFDFSSRQRRFIVITLVLSFVCLLFSFSRAGWVVAALGAFILLRTTKVKIPFKYYLISLALIVSTILITVLNFPYVADVVIKSLNGKEASAADRGNNFQRGLEKSLLEPFGHGLGTTDHRYNYQFYSESSFLNIAYEIGVLGLIYLLILHVSFIRNIINIQPKNFKMFGSLALAISIPTLLVCFVSVNPYAIPFVYFWWLILGLGMNRLTLLYSTN